MQWYITLLFLQSIWIWLLQSANASFRRAAKVKKTVALVCLPCKKMLGPLTTPGIYFIGLLCNALFALGNSPELRKLPKLQIVIFLHFFIHSEQGNTQVNCFNHSRPGSKLHKLIPPCLHICDILQPDERRSRPLTCFSMYIIIDDVLTIKKG